MNCDFQKGINSLSKLGDDIIARLNVKYFPQDYIGNVAETINLRMWSTISKGEDLCGQYVSIDEDKEYYRSQEMARYVYYCAKRGLTNVPVPEDIKSILSEFENDLDKWKNNLEREIETITDGEAYEKKLFKICINKLKYPMLEEF